MAISQTITAFPAAPNAGSDTPEEFSNKADAFVAHQSDNYVGEVNTWATQANSTATDVNTSATNAQLRAWESEASRLTSDSYAVQPVDVFVDIYTSNGDGTYTATPTTDYSALHHQTKGLAQDASTKLPMDGSLPMTGNLEAPSMSIGGVTVDIDTYGIENGSNANGDYVKFPDGTMICYAILGGQTTSNANGSIFISSGHVILFPETFITTPTITCGVINGVNAIAWGITFNVSTTGGTIAMAAGVNNAYGNVTYQAIGRWK